MGIKLLVNPQNFKGPFQLSLLGILANTVEKSNVAEIAASTRDKIGKSFDRVQIDSTNFQCTEKAAKLNRITINSNPKSTKL